jgi:hypothetical protein
MVGCEGDASPYFTCGVIDAATKGCILRTEGETRRHKNPHSVPHEQLVPTAGLPYCPAGREAVDRTGAGFHQPRLGVYRSGTRHGSNLRGPGTRVYERGTPPPCLHGRWHRERSEALSSTARGPPKGAAKTPRRRFHQRRPRRQAGGRDTHHETSGPVQRCRPQVARRDERTCTTMQAACLCDVLRHAWG